MNTSNHHHIEATLSAWRGEVSQLRTKFFDERTAMILSRCINEMERALKLQGEEELTLAEASRESGYSTEHLGRLIRQGTIPNAGRPNAPRIHRRDVPRKASRDLCSEHSPAQYELASREQIARSIVRQ